MSFLLDAGSLAQLDTCAPDLARVIQRAAVLSPFPFRVLLGFRDQAAQEAAFAAGLTQEHWPNGKHNQQPSEATDLAPVPIDWKDTARFTFLAGVVMAAAKLEGVDVRWGGDWAENGRLRFNHFNDLGHFEIVEAAA